jgi:hypothetical protein
MVQQEALMANVKVIKTNWRGRGAGAPLARAMTTLGRTLESMRMEDGSCLQKRAGRMVIPSRSASSLNLSKFCFGVTFSGATVTIKGGEMQWGVNDPSIMEDAGPISLTADYQYVGVEFDRDSHSIVTIGPDANASLFRSDSQKFRTWLHQYRLISGKASLYRIGHLGNFDITGWFGA